MMPFLQIANAMLVTLSITHYALRITHYALRK